MSVRLIEITVPDEAQTQAQALIARHCRRYWRIEVPGPHDQFSCLVQGRYVERFLRDLDRHFGGVAGFQAVVITTEALIPPLPETRATTLPRREGLPPPSRIEAFFSRDRISTDELNDDLAETTRLDPTYILTVILSAIIAALGMRADNVAVVIGAMVIAPLLGPSMGMALSATVGDLALAKRSVFTLMVGALAAVAATGLVGLILPINPSTHELALRTTIRPADVALAIASGAAGVLAFSRGRSLSLVGVMIAVALVPPLAAAGLFLAKSNFALASAAFFLFATNLVSINLAGIVTFLFQGLPPKSWRLTAGIMLVWLIILALFVAAMIGRVALGHGVDDTMPGI